VSIAVLQSSRRVTSKAYSISKTRCPVPRRWPILRHALLSVSVGYAVLIAAAALTLLTLQAIGGVQLSRLGTVPEVKEESRPVTVLPDP